MPHASAGFCHLKLLGISSVSLVYTQYFGVEPEIVFIVKGVLICGSKVFYFCGV
jgi:hypothetical protein